MNKFAVLAGKDKRRVGFLLFERLRARIENIRVALDVYLSGSRKSLADCLGASMLRDITLDIESVH